MMRVTDDTSDIQDKTVNLVTDDTSDIQDKDGEPALHRAVRNNNDNAVGRLIKAGCNVDQLSSLGESPLYVAVCYGRDQISNMLIDENCNVNNLDNLSVKSPVYKAVYDQNYKIVKMLIAAKCNTNIRSKGETPLVRAVANSDQIMATILIRGGCDINKPNITKQTPLFKAVFNNNQKMVKLLINEDADVNIPNKLGETPLYIAVYNKNLEIVTLLFNGKCDINLNYKPERSHLIRSIHQYLHGFPEMINLLLKYDCGINLSCTPGLQVLHLAAKYQNIDLIKLLIRHQAYILTEHKNNMLQLIQYLLCQNDVTSMEFFINYGLYINTCNNADENILHLLAKVYFEYSYYNYDWLLSHGLDINHINNTGNSPLMVAAFLNNKPFLDFLTKSECKVNIQNKKGQTALYMCIIGFTVLKHALNKIKISTIVDTICEFCDYPVYLQCVDILLIAGADVNIQYNGKTLLMLAAGENDYELLRKLLISGGNINILDNDGVSALQYIDFNINCVKSFNLLLSHGGHHLLNISGGDGNTIIQKMMLFPALWQAEEICSFIKFLIANNVSLMKLKPVCGDNYYNDISLNEFSSEERQGLRQLLFLSGASYEEIVNSLTFDTEINYGLSSAKICFAKFCSSISLIELNRKRIRQLLGLDIKERYHQLELPYLEDFILLKDVLPMKYFDTLIDFGNLRDTDYSIYDLDLYDEDYQDINIKYLNCKTDDDDYKDVCDDVRIICTPRCSGHETKKTLGKKLQTNKRHHPPNNQKDKCPVTLKKVKIAQ